MEIGIDSFASNLLEDGTSTTISGREAISQLLDRIDLADRVGLDVFGIGFSFTLGESW